jgi:radical SAM/Cys-rich protein
MDAATTIQFTEALSKARIALPTKDTVTTLQINLGKRCNQTCTHCHVGAGPKNTEIMSRTVAQRVLSLVESSPHVQVVDLTGGAPELNPNFEWLVKSVRALGRRVIDRCNLTVLTEKGMETTADFLAENQVEIVASLPCYTMENVDRQRGAGTFQKSIVALKRLNDLGYGKPGSGLVLDLVYNPGGPALPGPQSDLQAAYTQEMARGYGVSFNRLLTIVNMPILRFADRLDSLGQRDEYMGLLYNSFNPSTVGNLMCRSYVSVSWDGRLFDCDFNQMLEMPLTENDDQQGLTVFSLDSLEPLEGRSVATDSHCFGCTAGAGSGCQGALK